ncbi:Uncharacterised protein [uncultured archaeon]|nr:Uncharacterised protein [uncultured archaeon]
MALRKKRQIRTAQRKKDYAYAPKHILTTQNNLRFKKIIWFCAKFFVIYFVLQFLIELADLSSLNNFIAYASASLIGIGYLGNTVFVAGEVFTVTNLCTGLVSASVLAAIVFSLRRPKLGQKAILFTSGLVLLMLINIPRVSLVLYSAMLGFDAELVHTFTWFIMSAAVLLIWYYGTKRIAKVKDFSELV